MACRCAEMGAVKLITRQDLVFALLGSADDRPYDEPSVAGELDDHDSLHLQRNLSRKVTRYRPLTFPKERRPSEDVRGIVGGRVLGEQFNESLEVSKCVLGFARAVARGAPPERCCSSRFTHSHRGPWSAATLEGYDPERQLRSPKDRDPDVRTP